jgi:hypothetical protein
MLIASRETLRDHSRVLDQRVRSGDDRTRTRTRARDKGDKGFNITEHGWEMGSQKRGRDTEPRCLLALPGVEEPLVAQPTVLWLDAG